MRDGVRFFAYENKTSDKMRYYYDSSLDDLV